MAVQMPTPAQLLEAATEVGLALTDDDVKSYLGLIKPNVDAYNLVDFMLATRTHPFPSRTGP